MLLEIDAGDGRRARERVGDIAIGLAELDQQVAGAAAVGGRRSWRQRRPGVRHRRQRLVVDRDQRRRILREVARLRDHHRHRLAHERDLVPGEHERRDVGRQLRAAKLQRQPLAESSGARSASVNTACTPGSRRAAPASMPRIAAWACGLRTKAASSVPGNRRSSTKRALPVSSGRSSIRLTDVPM